MTSSEVIDKKGDFKMANIITRTDAEALIPVESSKEIIQAV